MLVRINIAKDFSQFPGGRYISDGPYSGEKFRETLLTPNIRGGNKLEIDLDGTLGYGSSFLEEAFGGLVRKGFSCELIKHLMCLKTSDDSLEERIWGYIKNETIST